jgi:hypothetical protein
MAGDSFVELGPEARVQAATHALDTIVRLRQYSDDNIASVDDSVAKLRIKIVTAVAEEAVLKIAFR